MILLLGVYYPRTHYSRMIWIAAPSAAWQQPSLLLQLSLSARLLSKPSSRTWRTLCPSLLPRPLSLRVIPDHAHDPELVIVARKHRSGCTLVNAVTTRDAADSRSVCAQRKVP
jgi:hypothetical protein